MSKKQLYFEDGTPIFPYRTKQRKHKEDFHNEFSYELYLDRVITDLVNAITPFAEKPSTIQDDYPCHVGITTKEECGRCSRAFEAWEAIQQVMEDKS